MIFEELENFATILITLFINIHAQNKLIIFYVICCHLTIEGTSSVENIAI